jgi:ABC-type glutathione transport system ATPase component
MGDRPLLEIDDLSLEYRSGGFGGVGQQRLKVLDGLTIELRSGETLSLLGESGSGKTSLARCIMGLVAPTGGSIRLDGADITRKSASRGAALEARRRIQLVPQGTLNSLVPNFTVARLIGDILRRRNIGGDGLRGELLRLIQLCGLDPVHLDATPGELSGGQRQRVLIARAMAMDPDVLILDEPVASLDVSIQARILNTLAALRTRRGLSMIFITHDLDIAEYIGDRMAIIADGRIIESGPVDEMVNRPRTSFAREMIAAGLSKNRWFRPDLTGRDG